MEELIEYSWRPAKRTSSSLIKLGYSQKQLDTIGKVFLQRFGGQTIDNASTKFKNMVRSSGAAHNTPKPDMTAGKELDKQRAKDIANRPKDAHDKAEAAKTIDSDKMTDEEAIKFYNRERN